MRAAIHPRISVSGICTHSWDLHRTLAFWDEHGIDHVGLPVAKLEAAGWDGAVREVARRGLRVGNLIGPGHLRVAEPEGWPAQRDRLRRVLDAAHTLGAGCVVLTTGPAAPLTWEEAAERLCEALGPVVEDAGSDAVPLAFEHTNSLRADIGFVHTLRDAVHLARLTGTGVCVELNACWMERGLGDTIADGVDTFRLVQASDFVLGTLDTPNRAVPGDGHIPLPRLLGQVLAARYRGAFDLEIIGPRIEAEGYGAAVRRSIDVLGDMLRRLGA